MMKLIIVLNKRIFKTYNHFVSGPGFQKKKKKKKSTFHLEALSQAFPRSRRPISSAVKHVIMS